MDEAARRGEVIDLAGKLMDVVGVDVMHHALCAMAAMNPLTRGLVAKVACPQCASLDVRCRSGNTVLAGGGVRRHRQCNGCGKKFTTLSLGNGEVIEARAVVGSQKAS